MDVNPVHVTQMEHILFLLPHESSGSEKDVCVPHGYGLVLMGLVPTECLTQYLLRSVPHTGPYPESTSLEAKAEPEASVAQKGPESQQRLGAV